MTPAEASTVLTRLWDTRTEELKYCLWRVAEARKQAESSTDLAPLIGLATCERGAERLEAEVSALAFALDLIRKSP